MKTVIDAVNEFKGAFDNGNFANTHNENFLTNDDYVHMIVTNQNTDLEIGTLVVYSEVDERDDVDFICTRKQFNDLVTDCSLNFGKCSGVALAVYVAGAKQLLTKSDKELEVMDIDWGKAPEGATHYDGFLYYKECLGYFEFFCTDSWEWKRSGSSKSLLLHHMVSTKTSQQPKPVFTQEMCDNGELPSVGMECFIDGTGVIYIVVLAADNEGDCILTPKGEDGNYWQRSNVKHIKPAKTDKEKAIDYMQYAYDKGNNMADVLSEIEKGYVKGVSFQPLTVEVK